MRSKLAFIAVFFSSSFNRRDSLSAWEDLKPPILKLLPSSLFSSSLFSSNRRLTDKSLFLVFRSFTAFPLFSGMHCLVGLLQDGVEDSEMFSILQMACDHNCTAEGSCCHVLKDCLQRLWHCCCCLLVVADLCCAVFDFVRLFFLPLRKRL